MLQQAAPSTQQAPHPLTAHATRTCCRLTAVDPLHAAGSLQAPLLIDLAMVAKQHCAAEGPGRVGARPDELLLWEADEPDHVEDVTDHVDAKLAALRAHTSQFRSTMGVDPDDPTAETQWAAFSDRIRGRLAEWGDLGGCTHGEGFKRIDRL